MGPRFMLQVGSPHYYYGNRPNCLMLNRIREDPALPTLTSISYRDSTGMKVEDCVGHCNNNSLSLAGLTKGTDCCECTSICCLPDGL